MKLYERFGERGYHTSIITSFGVDFDAYENVVLPRLRGGWLLQQHSPMRWGSTHAESRRLFLATPLCRTPVHGKRRESRGCVSSKVVRPTGTKWWADHPQLCEYDRNRACR
jgi:hypothetical protein